MDEKYLAYVDAADDLYAAFCDYATTDGQREALKEFAYACNAWALHPRKGGAITQQKCGLTFMEIFAAHKPDEPLYFRHPDLAGTCGFAADGELIFIPSDGSVGEDGNHMRPPLWLSDFDRDDWTIDDKSY